MATQSPTLGDINMEKDMNSVSDLIPKEFLELMSLEEASIYFTLMERIASLKTKWEHYRQLYGTSPEIIKLLNETAPKFFGLVERTLHDDMLLHICRLTDPESTGKSKNLSIRRLINFSHEANFSRQLNKEIDHCIYYSKYARDWRNKMLAHDDLARALDPLSFPIKKHSRACMQNTVNSMVDVFNMAHKEIFGSRYDFDYLVPLGDKQALLYALHDSKTLQDHIPEWKKQGNPLAQLFPNIEFPES
jgi:hypothetical protein